MKAGWITGILLILAVLVVPIVLGRSHSAVARVDGSGTDVTLRLRALIGLHSDWHRNLVVRMQDGSVYRVALVADTGWWRGSQLYRRDDGVLVLDEGQAGCLVLPPSGGPDGCPRQDGWDYLGRFEESGSDHPERVRFLRAGEAEEIDLPDIL